MSIWEGSGGESDPTLSPRVTVLEDTEYVYEVFESISSGTSGVIAPGAGATILLDRYPGAGDALLVKMESNIPTDEPVLSAAPALVTASLDIDGNYVLSGTPSAYPVALVYQIKVKAKDANGIPIYSIVNKTDINFGTSGGGIEMATFNAVLDFGRGNTIAYVTIPDVTMTGTKIIEPFFTSDLDEVAILAMNVRESSRSTSIGFTLIGVAPNGAFGTYSVRVIISGS